MRSGGSTDPIPAQPQRSAGAQFRDEMLPFIVKLPLRCRHRFDGIGRGYSGRIKTVSATGSFANRSTTDRTDRCRGRRGFAEADQLRVACVSARLPVRTACANRASRRRATRPRGSRYRGCSVRAARITLSSCNKEHIFNSHPPARLSRHDIVPEDTVVVSPLKKGKAPASAFPDGGTHHAPHFR
jgi:hypothetical protein